MMTHATLALDKRNMSAVVWERAIRPHFAFLHDRLSVCKAFIDALYRRQLLGVEEYHKLNEGPDSMTRADKIDRLLLEYLPQKEINTGKGQRVVDSFVRCLKDSSQAHLASKILENSTGTSSSGERRDEKRKQYRSKVVDDKLVREIAPHLGQWKKTARFLGFSPGQIENFEADNYRNSEEQGTQMLTKWIRQKGQEATVGVLLDAFKRAGKLDLIDTILDFL